MKIAVLADVHDNIWNLDQALKVVKSKSCRAVVFCGDLCAPFTAQILTKSGLPTYTVWGNADEDHWAIVERGGENLLATPLSQEFGEVKLGGKKIAFCHYPKLGELLAKTGYYDAVFHGHTHRTYRKKSGRCLVANPGAVCGIVGGKEGLASMMVYDTGKNKVELITFDEQAGKT